MLIAHSSDQERGKDAQSYANHVGGVALRASDTAQDIAKYSVYNGAILKKAVSISAEYHDLGKLDEQNQRVLSGLIEAKHLPVHHADAGTAHLMDNLHFPIAAMLIRSHHIGLPDLIEEQNRAENVLRDESVREKVDKTLRSLLKLHQYAMQNTQAV